VTANFAKTVIYGWLSFFVDSWWNKIFQAYEVVTTSTTVQACWEKASFTYQRRIELSTL
jgi:hypothetical protein